MHELSKAYIQAARENTEQHPELSAALVKHWIEMFWEREQELHRKGRYPKARDKDVWDKDENGKWIKVPGITWQIIDYSLVHGTNGLTEYKYRSSSLPRFREEYGLVSKKRKKKPKGKIQSRIGLNTILRVYHEKMNGNYPYALLGEAKIWRKTILRIPGGWKKTQYNVIKGDTWFAIARSMYLGERKFTELKGTRLEQYIAQEITAGRLPPERKKSDTKPKPAGSVPVQPR